MASCFIGPEIHEGLEVFKETFSTTGDFVLASNKSLEYLNDKGVGITKLEFDNFVEANFKALIPNAEEYFGNRSKKLNSLMTKVQSQLGIIGQYTTGKKGKYTAGKISVEAQETLQEAIEIGFGGKESVSALITDAESIGMLIKDAISHNDPSRLTEALALIETIRTEGESQLAKRNKDRIDNIRVKADKAAEAISRLSVEHQKAKDRIIQFKDGDLDYSDIVADLATLGINIPNASNLEPADLAFRALTRLAIKERPLWPTLLAGFRKSMQQFVMWENFDLGSYLAVIDRRGAKEADGGILETTIHDTLRKGDQDIRVDKEKGIEHLGKGLAEIFGVNFTQGKAPYSGVQLYNKINAYIKDKAYESKRKIATTTILADNTIWEPTAGEVAQLYLDSFNPDHAVSIENAGVTMADLKAAVSQLTEREIAFAKWIQSDFYPYLLAKENKTYEQLFGIKMPFDASYGGPVSYIGDTEVDNTLAHDGAQRRHSANTALSNSGNKQGKNINLQRNIFSNVLGRLDSSSKFTGGSVAYNELNGIVNDPKVIKALETAQLNGSLIHKRINARIEHTFGLSATLPQLPSFVNQLTSSITFTALAFKPKLLLNQVTSSLFWLTEESTYTGIKGNSEFEQELKTANGGIVKAMFNNSPIVRARYTKENLIGLSSALDEVELGAGILDKSNKFTDAASSFLMSPTLLGDAIGVFVGGKQYFVGEYIKARKKGLTEKDAAYEAGYRFGKKLSKTQQSFLKVDKSDMQNSNWRIFTQFQTSPRQFRRIIVDNIRQIFRSIDPRKESKGSVFGHAAKIAMFHSIGGGMYYVVMQALPYILLNLDEDDEEKAKKFFATEQGGWSPWVMGAYGNSIFILGDVIDAVRNAALDEVFDTDIGSSSAFAKLNKAKKEFLKLSKYHDRYDLNANQRLAYERAQVNAWMYLAEGMFTFPATSLGLTAGPTGDIGLVKLVKDVENGDWDSMEFGLKRFGYSDYIIEQSGSAPAPSRKKKRKTFGGKKGFGKKKTFGKKKKFK